MLVLGCYMLCQSGHARYTTSSVVTATHHYVLRTVYVCLILRTAMVRLAAEFELSKGSKGNLKNI